MKIYAEQLRSVLDCDCTSKQINVKVVDRTVKLQQERRLMKKLVVISRTRPELDVAECRALH